jgi:uncharacterized protein (DUF1330 family)
MKIYDDNVSPTIKGHDVNIPAAHGPKGVLEGRESAGIIITEFPSTQAAQP